MHLAARGYRWEPCWGLWPVLPQLEVMTRIRVSPAGALAVFFAALGLGLVAGPAAGQSADAEVGSFVGSPQGTLFGCTVEVAGGEVGEPASIDELALALKDNPACTTFELSGHFSGTTPVIINRAVTITGLASKPNPVLWGSTLRLEAPHIAVRQLHFRRQTGTAITVGRREGILGPAQRADGAIIENNRFTESFNDGVFAGAVIQVAGIDGNSVTPTTAEPITIRSNEILDYGRNPVDYRGDDPGIDEISSRFFHGIRVGRSQLRADRSEAPYTFNPMRQRVAGPDGRVRSEPVRVIIEDNTIKTDVAWGSGYHSAVQVHDPSRIEGNCVVGGDIGIEIKGHDNVVTGNKLVRVVRRNRHASGAALYQRDGDRNRYTENLVVQSTLGFEAYSGSNNVFFRNVVLGSRVSIGRIHGAYHGGSRGDTDIAVDEPDLLTGQTTYRFAFENSLIAHNTFANNNGGIHWHLPEAGKWELPNRILLRNNTFDRGRRALHEKQAVLDLGDEPPAQALLLERWLRALNSADGNNLANGFRWNRLPGKTAIRPMQPRAELPNRWTPYTRNGVGAGQGIGAAVEACN